jgi:outer membrane biosynthesis protein TonB
MKLWELRSYDDVIALEQERLVERMRLRKRHGRLWRRKAPVETMIAYRMMRYGRGPAPAGAVTDPALVPAVPRLPQPDALDDFDAVAASAIAVAQPDAADECASVQPQPSAQPAPAAQPEVQLQPDAQPVVQPQPSAQPTPDAQPQPVVQPQPDRKVTRMRTPEEMAQLLEDARVVNLQALRDSNNKASLRKLQKELSIGQRTAQLIQPQLPDTLDAALAEAQPNMKEA